MKERPRPIGRRRMRATVEVPIYDGDTSAEDALESTCRCLFSEDLNEQEDNVEVIEAEWLDDTDEPTEG